MKYFELPVIDVINRDNSPPVQLSETEMVSFLSFNNSPRIFSILSSCVAMIFSPMIGINFWISVSNSAFSNSFEFPEAVNLNLTLVPTGK
ncbi:hypothetical protein D3C86_1265980 [compost metagenome]